MNSESNDIEGRFIAAVIKDDTDRRRSECRNLPADVFESHAHRKAWKGIVAAPDYLTAAEGAATYFANPTIGTEYAADRDQLFVRVLLAHGLNWAREWIEILPAARARMPLATTAAALCRNPPEVPPELISGVLYGSGTMMLSGPSKSRKTYTFLDLAVSVATGTPWFGFATTKAPVVYLNFELAEHSFQRRLAAICSAKGVTPPDTLHTYNLRGRTATLGMLSDELPSIIRTTGAGLVIIDPWYKISAQSGAEENSNDGQARVLAEAERIVNSSGAALVVGHHFAKGDASGKNSIDRAAGAGAMARWGDVITTLSEHEEADAMTLEFHLRDFAPVDKFAVRWQQPLWARAPELDPAKLKKGGRVDEHPASELLKVLKNGMTNRDWFVVAEGENWKDATFRRKRDQLIKAKKVELRGGCFYHVEA